MRTLWDVNTKMKNGTGKANDQEAARREEARM